MNKVDKSTSAADALWAILPPIIIASGLFITNFIPITPSLDPTFGSAKVHQFLKVLITCVLLIILSLQSNGHGTAPQKQVKKWTLTGFICIGVAVILLCGFVLSYSAWTFPIKDFKPDDFDHRRVRAAYNPKLGYPDDYSPQTAYADFKNDNGGELAFEPKQLLIHRLIIGGTFFGMALAFAAGIFSLATTIRLNTAKAPDKMVSQVTGENGGDSSTPTSTITTSSDDEAKAQQIN